MARRHSGKAKGGRSKPRGFNPKESKIERWEKPSDIPLDEEDQFHASRDKILLEGDEYADEYEGDEDEVFALKGVSDGSEEEDEDEEEEEEEEEEEDYEEEEQATTTSKKNARSKGKKGKEKSLSESDEDSEEEEEAWGKTKSAYYSSNAAQIESDDEEANELEEQEAKRLQAKARDVLADDDFGLGDPIEVPVDAEDVLTEEAPAPVEPLPQDKQSLLRHLERTSPESLALARDWDDIAHKLVQTQEKLTKIEAGSSGILDLGMGHMYYQALLTYATTLAFYLHLRASEKYAQRPELLRSHPIYLRLFSLKQSLATLEDLDFDMLDNGGSAEDDEDDFDESEFGSDDIMHDAMRSWASDKKKGLKHGELEDLLRDAKVIMSPDQDDEQRTKHRTKALTPEEKEPPKKKQKTSKEKAPAPVAPVFDLVEPDLAQFKSPTSTKRSESSATDVYGEATSLQAADAQDKSARKKSLRFHTARIESTAARRQSARAGAMGGDDDIPYRERKKEKEARVAREVAKTRGQGGEDLVDAEPEPQPEKRKRRRDDDDDEGSGSEDDGADGYYDLVQHQSKEKKARKKAEYEAARAAERPEIDESADGPRALTRAILKNKGLTPHRGKSVRNPRVKKRQRFEKAKRKVASQKAVYKGGIGESGRYDGEKSGISRVVKSVRL